MKRCLAALLLVLTGCAHALPTDPIEINLPRIVATDGNSNYPDTLVQAEARMPRTLSDAVDSLFKMTPKSNEDLRPGASCVFSSRDEIDAGDRECYERACLAIPPRSRDLGCGFLTRVADWAEAEWLGGLCRLRVQSRDTMIVNWFRSKGIFDCHDMSAAIMIAYRQRLVGQHQAESQLLEIFRVE